MNTMLKKFTITTAAILLVSAPAFAGDQRDREAGPRAVRLVSGLERAGALVRLPVSIDMTGVELNSAPAVLGGYIVLAKFDPSQVRFEGAIGGTNPMFSSDPITTDVEKANAIGEARVVGYQTNLYAPIGMISVASLQFTELVAGGGASIQLEVIDAAASPTPGADGQPPQSISLRVKDETPTQ